MLINKIEKALKEKRTFKEVCEEAGYNHESVHHMFKRGSLKCEVAEKLLKAAGYELRLYKVKDNE